MDTYAVIDFETTGMTPAQGARATEIGVVLVQDGRIVDQYASLMRSDAWIPPFIEQLTGISNAMVRSAPAAEQVMHEVSRFTAGCGLVAHNASFDRHFWLAERQWAGCQDDSLESGTGQTTPAFNPYAPRPSTADQPASDPAEHVKGPFGARTPRRLRPTPEHQPPVFACTLLLARRLYPQAPNHKLGTLASWHALPDCGRAHRALADALTTAHLLIRMQHDLRTRLTGELAGQPLSHALLTRVQRLGKDQLARTLLAPSEPPSVSAVPERSDHP